MAGQSPRRRLYPLPVGMPRDSVGLQGPGVGHWLEDELPALERSGARVVVSIWGRRVEDFATAAAMLSGAPSCVVAVEVNISCPNVEDRRRMFAHSATVSTAEGPPRDRSGTPSALGQALPERGREPARDVAGNGARRGSGGTDTRQHRARARDRPRDSPLSPRGRGRRAVWIPAGPRRGGSRRVRLPSRLPRGSHHRGRWHLFRRGRGRVPPRRCERGAGRHRDACRTAGAGAGAGRTGGWCDRHGVRAKRH